MRCEQRDGAKHALLRATARMQVGAQAAELAQTGAFAILARSAQLLREARVIGATTTGAAKYGALLRELAPQIIVIEEAAEVLEAHVKRGDELIAHGRNQVERQIEMTLEQEREMVQDVTRTFTERNGVKPVGWMSPYLTPSEHTTDLLAENGYQYCMDWGICDEQPFWVKSATGSMLAMPYPIELNDQPAVVYRRNTGAEYAEMLVDNFDEMLRSSKDAPLP